MSRIPRIEFSGALYHVLNRGNNKNNIFLDEKDYRVFLNHLEEVKQEKDFVLYSYCLMPNHFHLLVKTNEFPLSKIMQKLLTSYAIYFNSRYDRKGHLFQNRYKAIICDKENYLFSLIQYIHLNPLRAGLVKNINDYKWSSHQTYIGRTKSKILCVEKFFNDIGEGSFATGYSVYNNLIATGFDEKLKENFEKAYKSQILGTDEFIRKIKEEKSAQNKVELKNDTFKQPDKNLADILDEICSEFKISKTIVLAKNRSKVADSARNKFYYKAFKEQGFASREIAKFVNRDISIISKVLGNRMGR